MELPLITIAVPAYNVEDYLKRCLQSIADQTYKNIEVLVIDDGSTDKTGNIAGEFEKKDSRFRTIHQKNQGIAGARNTAVSHISGEYFMFIDSDDLVTKDYVEHLYQNLLNHKCEISICHHQRFYDESEIDFSKQEDVQVTSMTGLEAMEDVLYRKTITTSPWGKLFKAGLFQDIQYPCGMLYEDLATTYKLLGKAGKVCFSTARKYCYFQRAGSLIHSKFNDKNLIALKIADDILAYVKGNYPECIRAAESRHFVSCVQLYRLITKEKKYKEAYIRTREEIKKRRKTVLFDKKAKGSTRMLALIACINVWLLRFMGKSYTMFIQMFRIKVNY